jgi:hypothetical protein
MKRTNFYLSIAAIVAVGSLASCSDRDDYYTSNGIDAVVTVKTTDDGRAFLQLDDQTTLMPSNMDISPFDREVRALINFWEESGPSGIYDHRVRINRIDSIRTKSTEPFIADENDELYGTSPVDIYNDWITVVEDGYLTLHLSMAWGDPKHIHYVHLLTGGNPEDPYEVELRHDANGDPGYKPAQALMAFRLDQLPDTEGETVTLTLKWKSANGGNRTAEFDYCTREED